MKVLYLTTMYPTPQYTQKGIFCHEQVKALKRLGIDVDVVVPIPFYEREVSVKEWCYEGIGVKYVRFFKLPGANDFHRTGKVLFRVLERNIDIKKYDLYHADAPLPSGYAVMLASEKYKIPFLIHGHGLDVFLDGSYEGYRNCSKITEVCKEVYVRANAVVGVSQKVLEKIEKRVNIDDKAYVVYNGVDVEAFYPIKKEEKKEIVVTSIGNLIPLKGHVYTLKAFKKLIDKGYTNLRFQLAGRGELERDLKILVRELGIEQYVEFKGYVPYSDIVKLLQETDIFVLPSYYEALGCVYLEAMACEVPTIGCKGNGIDEIIVNGENGYLVNPKEAEEIVACLDKLLDYKTRRVIGKKARETVVEKYQWRHSAETLAKIYKKLYSVKEE